MKNTLYPLLVALLALCLPPAGHAQDEELLLPDQAFAFSARMLDANTVRAQWNIADGYYLYRGKISFRTDTDGVTLGTPKMPAGKVKEDEFFGKVETYRHEVIVDIPITRANAAVTTLNLIAKSQGCADLGVCYPPHKQMAALGLPPAAAQAPAPASDSAAPGSEAGATGVAALGGLSESLGLGGQQDEVLEPDQAFAFSADVDDAKTATARWVIAPGHYLYRDKTRVTVVTPDDVTLAGVELPPGETKQDEFFGAVQVFHDHMEATIRLARTGTEAVETALKISYQGCSEITGICYPPINKQVALTFPAMSAAPAPAEPAAAVQAEPEAAPAGAEQAPLSEQDSIARSLASGSALLTMLTFFGFGLLLAFTPCVFPMIPILSSIIIGQGEGLTTRKAFVMSLTYVLAMAITYTVAGVIAGLAGENLQAAFQNPWVLGTFSGVFVLLSLSMFGFYELQMPTAVQSRLTEISNRQQGGTLFGVAIMGFLSALIVGPCVAAPLAGALIYIGQTGDAYLGGAALFALSMGMGAPLLAIGTSAGKLLPRAGGWMDTVKAVFGALLLAVAIWMLERILPVTITMLLWGLLFIVSAIYLGALEPIKEGASGWFRLWKGLGVVLLVYGALMLVGVAAGGKDYMQPLHGLWSGGGGGTSEQHLTFKRIKSVEDLEREVAAASAQGKTVMLDFYADWCVTCKQMERETFSKPEVHAALGDAVLLQADVTLYDDDDKALLTRFGLFGPPAILFFGRDGRERRDYRVIG
ncbi:MAG: protein-disulfide reductase DsbD, partial [Pseudomonadota bacterium]